MAAEFERRRLRVYLAGPISKGDRLENIHLGLRWGRRMVQDGLAPYIPHLDAFMFLGTDDAGSAQWKALLEWDMEYVAQSEAVFRLPGESRGADLETEHAEALGIPVYYNYDALLVYAEWRKLRRRTSG